MQPAPKKLLDQVRDAIRLKHYAYSTEQAYVQWIKRFILFHDKRHSEEMGRTEVEAFLTHLAVEGVRPERETIESDTYAITRPFLLVSAPNPNQEVATFLQFARSPAGQAIVRRTYGAASAGVRR